MKPNVTRFGDLRIDATPAAIYSRAGKIYEEQVNGDPETDYTKKEHFEMAIWYIAQEAQRQGFIALENKSLNQIAKEMGDYISRSFGSRSQIYTPRYN